IGLITGRASAAEHDVTTVAAARWPGVRFAVRNTAVQGPTAVSQIVKALQELDSDDEVDVIVLARGGGSVEDLLPFSDETLCRTIAACRTPVISAVGPEPDNPLLAATETERIGHLGARLATLGPAATLARGYAVVQTVGQTVGQSESQV